MTQPKRIQRKRTRGWRMPENTIYVGRPSRFGNPFVAGTNSYDADEQRTEKLSRAVARFREWISSNEPMKAMIRAELRGKDLACWCRVGETCHADILLEIANEERNKNE